MKPFIHDDFMLENKTAQRLYHQYAENQPIIDFHCHLSPSMIYENRRFENLTQAWLEGDHYKWRAMRTNGVDEKYCTGNASDPEKFAKWAETVPFAVGNPLYHWTHLELARYFNINELLSPSTASAIYTKASEMLRTDDFAIRSLLSRMNVEVVCTTDDPADTLEYHQKLKGNFSILILPTWRPDNVVKTDDPAKFNAYIKKLGESAGTEIKSFSTLIEVLDHRHEFFNGMGTKASDHGLDRFYYAPFTTADAENAFIKLLKGETLSEEETEKYRTAVMTELCRMNHKRGWTQQFHVGAMRNNSLRMFRKMGPDTGWDSIGVPQDALKMSRFLSSLDETDQLARTILYNLNPADNEMMLTMAGNFNDGTIPVKVQYGAAWWFLDQKTGMEKHIRDLSSFGLMRRFIGMVTDSRSFLSYPRHEYFRRIVCNFVGTEVEKGLIPEEEELLRPIIEGISYKNAKEQFGF
ncbi:MAG TPA: glucuronate isomerase [Bacteroidales bacterium]|nr:glucuronate isomerase [Bacteroidales bacterium]HPF03608.1 glucuronate isomerase [Bacteroidales bacterium]HPJ59607.1 glucuronate isomerase [Bacteroidales bacterium]HPR10921.1 glucuronate isomerase [Bacteroidales bacterium]HRW84119.1 glucuronate isomerase [Bacteroidales bacterium]